MSHIAHIFFYLNHKLYRWWTNILHSAIILIILFMANKSLRVLKSFIKYKTVHLGTVHSIWWKITQNLQSCMSQAYIFSSLSHLGEIYTCINKDRALQMSIKGLDTKYSIIMYLYNLHNPLKSYYWYSVVTLTLQSQIFWHIFLHSLVNFRGIKN